MAENIPYEVGDIIMFTLKREHPNNVELIDQWGNTTYVNNLNGQLQKGQSVKCRISAFKNGRPSVKVVQVVPVSRNRWSVTKEDILAYMTEDNPHKKEFVSRLLTDCGPEEFEASAHRWVTNLAVQKAELDSLRDAVAHLLEDTDFLLKCTPEEHKVFAARMTQVIELLGYYITVGKMINDSQLDAGAEGPTPIGQFIEKMFGKLSTSGYIYHSHKYINLLVCLFTLQPVMMKNYLPRLFSIIRKRKPEDWQTEDYYMLLVKLLQIYVTGTDAVIDRQLYQKESLQGILQALSLIILLDKDADNVARARLLRYASYLNHTQEDNLLDMAWACLTGRAGKPLYTLDDTADSNRLAVVLANNNFICNMPDAVQTFTQRNVRFSIHPGGTMTFCPEGSPKTCKPVLPVGLLPWHDIQVHLADGLRSEVSCDTDNIFRFQQLWKEIEIALFHPVTPKKVLPQVKYRQTFDKGDRVSVYITHTLDTKPFTFCCRFTDNDEAQGIIDIYPDVVGYKPNANIETFLSTEGKPLVFPADIKEVLPDGTYSLTCRKIQTELQADSVSYDMHLVCSIGDYNQVKNRYSAVSKEGFSVSILCEPAMPPLEKFQVVEVAVTDSNTLGYYLNASFIALRDNEEFNLQDAFHQLMLNLSDGEVYEASSAPAVPDTVKATDADRTLTVPQIEELIKIIDRKAVYEKDYIRSYNYLAVAQLLSTMLASQERIRFYKGRMDLLVMLHDFAVNDRVDEEKLLQLDNENGELFRNNVQMNRRFQQLKIASYIGHEEKNSILFTIRQTNEDQGLRDLASLVLAHNLLKEQKLHEQAQAAQAYIKSFLHLKTRETTLKFYGVENTTTEFKTSLVYPAEGGMTANLDRQTKVVMRVVASMLNSGGGCIYLGVNDQGYGEGIDNDLQYKDFSGDRDKYIRHITDSVIDCFKKTTVPYVEVGFDDDNDKPVCIIRISHGAEAVTFDDKYPIRQNSQTIDLSRQDFEKVRQQLKKNAAEKAEEGIKTSTVEVKPVKKEETRSTVRKARQIPTAVYRYRLISDYNSMGYINLYENGGYSFTEYQMGSIPLSQPVYPDDQVLVIVYSYGYINRVPIDEITGKSMGREYVGVKDKKVVFAALAEERDFIFLHYKVKAREYVRVVPLDDLESGTMSDNGWAFTQDGVSEFIFAEVIPEEVGKELRLTKSPAGNGLPVEHKNGKYLINSLQKILKP